MPHQMNRSPCPQRLREHAQPPGDQQGVRLSERLQPDRGNATLREEKRNGKTVTLVDVNVATAGKVNRNMRLYSREVWQAAIDAAQPDLQEGKLWGLVEHPKDSWDDWDPLKGRLENIWVLYERLWMDGDQVKATGVIVDNDAGRNMTALLNLKLAVGISSNGTGSAKYVQAKEIPALADFPNPEAYIAVIQDDYRLLTIDAVSDPSDLSGAARQKETRTPGGPPTPPTPTPRKEERRMHELLKALMEKYQGKTLDQIKTEHAAEYLQALERIAESGTPAPAPAPAPVVPTPTVTAPITNAESTLEQSVLALNARLEASERQALTEKRTNIAITALEAAQLPRAPKVGELDLDARFREQLITVAVTAKDDAEAKALVDQMVTERRALMGATQQPTRPTETAYHRAGGVTLPAGNNSAPSRQVEGVNPIGSLRGSLGLK